MSARFFYYPEPNGSFPVTIDLEEDLGELFSDFFVDAVDGVTMGGSIQRSIGRSGEIITIMRDRLRLGADLAYQFIALQNHLDRGYSCSFCADHTKAWAAPVRSLLSAGVTKVHTFANPFINFMGTNTPNVNDFIIIESQPPAMLQECHKLTNVSNLNASQQSNFETEKMINFTYNRKSFAREHRTWPVLKRPQSDIGQNIITNTNGLLYSLNLRLIPDYSTLFSYHPLAFDGVGLAGDLLGGPIVASSNGSIPQGRSGTGIDGVPKRFDERAFELFEPIEPSNNPIDLNLE